MEADTTFHAINNQFLKYYSVVLQGRCAVILLACTAGILLFFIMILFVQLKKTSSQRVTNALTEIKLIQFKQCAI